MPQNKTKKFRKKQKQHKHSQSHNSSPSPQFKSIFDRTPTPYPYSNYSTIYSNSPNSVAPHVSQDSQKLSPSSYPNTISSSAYVKAVSNNGKQWHVDMDINGVKKHGNLTNSQIMDLLSYPASKQNLRSQLIKELHNINKIPIYKPHIKQHLDIPFIELDHLYKEPCLKYIYKKSCSTPSIMLNNLSSLQETSIVPNANERSIHLIPKKLINNKGNRSSSKYNDKTKSKNKKRKIIN